MYKRQPQDYSLVKLPNVIATPHIGASTYEAQEIVGLIISQQVFDCFKRGIIRNAVNAPSVRPELIPKIEPYVGLITKLGSFVVQLFDGRVEEFEIEYAGEVVEEGLYSTLTSSALAGVLKPILGNGVNEINAPYIAKQRGIRVIEKKSRDTEGFASLIKIVLRSKDKEASVCGTLIRKNDPRIVMVNGFPVEAEPRGYILYFKNYDRPGVIGRIGTLLGEANINIAGMRLGRFKPGEEAVALLNVDQPVPDELLKKIEELPNIIEVKMLNLD